MLPTIDLPKKHWGIVLLPEPTIQRLIALNRVFLIFIAMYDPKCLALQPGIVFVRSNTRDTDTCGEKVRVGD